MGEVGDSKWQGSSVVLGTNGSMFVTLFLISSKFSFHYSIYDHAAIGLHIVKADCEKSEINCEKILKIGCHTKLK